MEQMTGQPALAGQVLIDIRVFGQVAVKALNGVDPGKAVAVQLPAGPLHRVFAPLLSGQRVGDQGQDIRRRLIPQSPSGLSVGTELYRSGYLRHKARPHPARLQSQGVGHVDMQTIAGNYQRVVGADPIQLLPGGQGFLIGKQLVVEACPQNPFPLWRDL